MSEKITIVGSGSWGSALAKLLSEKGHNVIMWAHEVHVAQGINACHINPAYLSEIKLPAAIHATTDIEEALSGRSLVVSTVPSRVLRDVWAVAAAYLKSEVFLVSCTKGIEAKSLKLMSQVLAECLPNHPCAHRVVLSGPSFAHEVAKGLPTSVVVAGENVLVCKKVQEVFRTNSFLTFTNDDVVGVEVGGSVKNVIAIATGISDGLKLGHNSRAAIITRGLYEMIKIGKALGANPLTFSGLSGIGDLVLTCTARFSRNHTVGEELGHGRSLKDVLGSMKMVAEGVPTTKATKDITEMYGINAPICSAMFRILYEGLSPQQAVEDLCTRELNDELRAIMK